MLASRTNEAMRFAMLLTQLDDGVNTDRASLRRAGVQRIRSIRSGQEALRIIQAGQTDDAPFGIDFIVCSGDLPDMGMEDFIRSLAAMDTGKSGKLPPVLAIISGDDAAISRLLAGGVRAVLPRPYSVAELEAALAKMQEQSLTDAPATCLARPEESVSSSAGFHLSAPEMLFSAKAKKAGEQLKAAKSADPVKASTTAPKKQATAASTVVAAKFEPTVVPGLSQRPEQTKKADQQPDNSPEQINQLLYTRTGLSLLRQGKLASAQDFLRRALRFDPLDLEAAMGLARLHKQNGNADRAARWLHRAGMIYVRAGQHERAESIFSALPAKWRGDHYMIEAQNLLQDEDFDEACEAFMEISTRKKKPPIHEVLGRACQFTDSPEYFLYEMCAALERNGYASTARKLEKRMFSDRHVEVQPCGFLSRFPKLQEVVTVARFTMKVWRASEV